MALARVITNSIEAAQEVLELLRARGFEVEVVSPDVTSAQPSDLEIKLEELSPEEALDRAEQMPHSADFCAFIAPGTLSGERFGAVPFEAAPFEQVSFEGETEPHAAPMIPMQREAANADARGHSTFNAALAHLSSENGFEFGGNLERETVEHVRNEDWSLDSRVNETQPVPVPTPARPYDEWVETHDDEVSSLQPRRAYGFRPPSISATFVSVKAKTRLWFDLARVRAAFSSLPSQRYQTRTLSDASFWKAATVVAAFAVCALLLGALTHRASLLAKLPHPAATTQKAPFEPVSEPVSSPIAEPSDKPGESRPVQRPSTRATEIMDQILSESATPAATSRPDIMDQILAETATPAETSESRTSASSRRRSSLNRHDNSVADDVVVYYAKKPAPPAAPAVPGSIKRYSDLR